MKNEIINPEGFLKNNFCEINFLIFNYNVIPGKNLRGARVFDTVISETMKEYRIEIIFTEDDRHLRRLGFTLRIRWLDDFICF
ncbi:hypothetical protein BEH94_11755 [Candidatus Altiarchaeales archaeon WOR_SM1_SCG]|nr:hypothetical protein BEH94_11755 [Candidatus Altiarchaeales archaeon WOR_SM1_SCG]